MAKVVFNSKSQATHKFANDGAVHVTAVSCTCTVKLAKGFVGKTTEMYVEKFHILYVNL